MLGEPDDSRALRCGGWTILRLRYAACDTWGHALGDPDCDHSSPPAALTLAVESVTVRAGGGALAARANECVVKPSSTICRGLSTERACTAGIFLYLR